MPSINFEAYVQSAVVPCASTAKCIFVLSPLLSGSFLDYHLLLLLHEDVLYVASIDHQPFEIWCINQLFQQLFPNAFVSPPYKATLRIAPSTIIWW